MDEIKLNPCSWLPGEYYQRSSKLTDDSKINFTVPSRRVLEVDPALVGPFVGELDVVYREDGGGGQCSKVGPAAEHTRGRPQLRLGELATSHIKAEIKLTLIVGRYVVLGLGDETSPQGVDETFFSGLRPAWQRQISWEQSGFVEF